MKGNTIKTISSISIIIISLLAFYTLPFIEEVKGEEELTIVLDGPFYGYACQNTYINSTTTGGTPPYDYEYKFGNLSRLITQDEDIIRRFDTNEYSIYDITLTVTDYEDNVATDTSQAFIDLLYNATIKNNFYAKASESDEWFTNTYMSVEKGKTVNYKSTIEVIGNQSLDLQITCICEMEEHYLEYIDGSINYEPYNLIYDDVTGTFYFCFFINNSAPGSIIDVTFDTLASNYTNNSAYVYSMVHARINDTMVAADEWNDYVRINVTGETIYVDDDPGQDFQDITSALNYAKDGDVIYVYSGTYTGSLTINKNVKIIGENNKTVKIYGNGPGDTIRINHDNVEISNCKIMASGLYDDDAGIDLKADNVSVKNCVFTNHNNAAIKNFGNNNIFQNNEIYNSKGGINCRDESSNSIITNNNIYNLSGSAIRLASESGSNSVADNLIDNNDFGIVIVGSSNNIIDNNIISNNSDLGLYMLYNVRNNIVTNNDFISNEKGISMFTSGNSNKFYHNNFRDNNIHATDELNDQWDNGYPSGGNYWDNYTGIDSDQDGIGDTPYYIGNGDNQDEYPFMLYNGWEYSTFEISSPDSIEENTKFLVTITSNDDTVKNALVNFAGNDYYTSASGTATLTTPSVDQDTEYDITVNKNGYIEKTKTVTVTDVLSSSVKLISPNGNETLKGDSEIKWLANISEGSFSITIQYRANYNQWITIIEDFEQINESYNWDTTNVDDGYPYEIKIILKQDEDLDGFYETIVSQDTSNSAFTIGNTNDPQGWIRGFVKTGTTNNTTPLENAKILVPLSNKANEVTIKSIYTDENGSYNLKVPTGNYTMHASKNGYITDTKNNVFVWVNYVTFANFSLTAGVDKNKSLYPDSLEENRDLIEEGIKVKNVGGEIIFVKDEIDLDFLSYIIIYDGINITPLLVEKGNITFLIDGEENITGKTIVLNIDNEIIESVENLTLFYDGIQISKACDIKDVLNPNNDGSHPEYIITYGTNGTQILLSIPHFSQHHISISAATIEEIIDILFDPITLIYYLAVVLFIGIIYAGPIFYLRKK